MGRDWVVHVLSYILHHGTSFRIWFMVMSERRILLCAKVSSGTHGVRKVKLLLIRSSSLRTLSFQESPLSGGRRARTVASQFSVGSLDTGSERTFRPSRFSDEPATSASSLGELTFRNRLQTLRGETLRGPRCRPFRGVGHP